MKKISTVEFIEKAKHKHGDNYDYSLVKYINARTKVEIVCKIHGNFFQQPNNHLSGQGCSICGVIKNSVNRQVKTNDFIERAKNIHELKYDYSEVNVISMVSHVNIICPIHGIFKQFPSSHLNGRGCGKCANSIVLNIDDFICKANVIHNNKYNYSYVIYVNAKTKVNIECNVHGIFSQSPTHHLSGRGCPVCGESKGEKIISNYLYSNGYYFEREKKFKNCFYKKILSFDFYLPNHNTLIEFDGKHHFEEINFGKSEKYVDNLSIVRIRDEIKNKFALEYNYQLLRISYIDINNIETILSNYEPIFKR